MYFILYMSDKPTINSTNLTSNSVKIYLSNITATFYKIEFSSDGNFWNNSIPESSTKDVLVSNLIPGDKYFFILHTAIY